MTESKRTALWLVLLAAAGTFALTMGTRQTMGLFLSPLNTATGLGLASISLAFAFGQLWWGLTQPFAGVMADKIGAGRVLFIGAHHNTTTAYHPQSNGMVERAHRRLKDALKARMAAADWPQHLPWVLLDINNAPKEDTGKSAAQMVYGTSLTLLSRYTVQLLSTEAQRIDSSLRIKNQRERPHPTASSSTGPTGFQTTKSGRNNRHLTPATRSTRTRLTILRARIEKVLFPVLQLEGGC